MTDCIVESKLVMEELQAPFESKHIEWRVQAATRGSNGIKVLVLPYLTSRAIMHRLDQVCGGFWQSHYDKIQSAGIEAFQCRLSIKFGGEWITRTDAAEVSDFESVKGGHSNALKRAGVQWGIGRYLYDLDGFWVELKNQGQHNVFGNFKVNGQTEKLKGYFDTPKLPDWALAQSEINRGKNQNSNATKPSLPRNDSRPSQQKNDSLAQQSNGKKSPAEAHAQAVTLVTNLLTAMQVPVDFVAPLLERTSGATVHFTQATSKDLGKFYHALIPVKTYLDACREFNLDEQEIMYYAQIVHKTELNNAFSLVSTMTKDSCTKTLELIREDLKEKQAV